MNAPEITRCTCRCALAAAAITEPQPTARWRDLLAQYLQLKGEFESLPVTETAALDALYERFSPLEDRLLAMPTPDLHAVEWKLQYWRRKCETFVLEPQHFNSLIDDVQRLAS